MNHYEILGIDPAATPMSIRDAGARKLSEALGIGGAPEYIDRIDEAWRVLLDPALRAEYDQTLWAQPTGVAPPPPPMRGPLSNAEGSPAVAQSPTGRPLERPHVASTLTERFRPLGSLRFLVAAALLIVAAFGLAGIVAHVQELDLVNRVDDGKFVSLAEWEDSYSLIRGLALAHLAAYLATAVLFLRWSYLTYQNLAALGVSNTRFSPGWAVGAYFVPILNLWRPYQIHAEVWRSSGPGEGRSEDRRVTPVVKIWWGLWLLSGVGGWISFRGTVSADTTVDELRTIIYLEAAISAIALAAALLAIVVVWRIVTRQRRRRTRILLEQS